MTIIGGRKQRSWALSVATGVAGLSLCLSTAGIGQEFVKGAYTFPVTANGHLLEHPLTGGLYIPMHQFNDIDNDGDLDLFLYEFGDGNLFFYRNAGTPQIAEFRFERDPFTKPPAFGWFRLVDINSDGRSDFLTSTQTGNTLTVYLHTGTSQTPAFTLLTTALLDSAGIAVYAESYSISALCDIDADSDLDFFSLNSFAGTINFYENIGTGTDILLAFRTDFWQGIRICVGCLSSSPEGTDLFSLHGNGTMEFADIDADDDFDMFYGDMFDAGLFFFENIGTPQVAVMDSITGQFPPGDPVITAGFNQPTLVDIDQDEDLDMFVSVLFPLGRIDNFRLYTNLGDSTNYDFGLTTLNYLETLDFGLQSAPAFVDIDADNDPDLFVGDLDGHVAFLRNTGDASNPEFLLEDSSFVSSPTTYTYAPTFADIDGDADMDMFLGHFTGNIEFYRNTGTLISPIFERELWTFDTLTVGNYAIPAFVDIDVDEDLDLFVGRALGTISYYINNGTAQAWSFSLVSSSYQGIDVGDNSKPHCVDLDGDDDQDLLIGAFNGTLSYYRNDGPPGNPVFVFVTSSFGSADSVRDSSPAVADVDNDNDLDLLLGNYRGGLEFYRYGPETSVGDEDHDRVPHFPILHQNYPNPFNPSTLIRFSLPGTSPVDLRIFDLLGQEVAVLIEGILPGGQHEIRWDPGQLAGSVYFYRLRANGVSVTKKLILLR